MRYLALTKDSLTKMNGKVYLVVVFLIFSFIMLGVWIFNHHQHPEQAILGTWKEVDWVYAKVNGKKKAVQQALTSEERYEVANHLVIHKFENWTFFEDRTVRLHEASGSEHKAKWRISGRGHILKIINPDETVEVYQIETLTQHRLILHFETNVHARGIVKITFKR